MAALDMSNGQITHHLKILEEEDVVLYHQSKGPLQVSLSFSQPFNSDGDIWVESTEYEIALEPGRFEIFVGQ